VLDTVIAGGTVWALGSVWTDGLGRLEAAERLARQIGFEHKRAALLAHLVRFLAWKERPDDARSAYEEGRAITARLGLEREAWRLESAWGYALYEQKRHSEAVDMLLPVCEAFERTKRLADLTRAGLDLADAAYGLWEQGPINRAFAILEEHEIGYRPHVQLAYAELYLKNDDLEQALASAGEARKAAEETRNSSASQMAQSLLDRINAARDG
jgi:hypothetical protein